MKGRGRGLSAVMLALLAGTAGSLASCGLIVGDYKVGDAGTDATGDQANEVGGGGDVVNADRVDTGGGDVTRDVADVTTADTASEGVDVQADQDGGADADAVAADADATAADAEAGSADADGAAPEAEASVVCGQGIPTGAPFTNLVRTCVFVTSCDPYLLPLRLSDCIGNAALLAAGDAGVMSCLSSITDCTGYYGCQGIRVANGSSPTECSGFASSCVGNVAHDCSGSSDGGVPSAFGTVTNCALTPGGCQTFTDSYGNGRAGCVVAPSCTVSDAGGWQCSGNDLYQCISSDGGSTGVGYGHSCGSATCVTSGNTASCTFVGTGVCGADNGTSCSGTTLQQACTYPSLAFNFDCTQSGSACMSSGTGTSGCVSPGCSLSSTCTESCDGISSITTCIGGADYTLDCTNFGSPSFSSCHVSTAGSPSWCVP
jgi:hypothetical protein